MRTLSCNRFTAITALARWVKRWLATGEFVWNPGISRGYNVALKLNLIDPRIAPLVGKLNSDGVVSTFTSCEGHWEEKNGDNHTFNSPYIGFQSTIEFAARLNQSLVDGSPVGTCCLHYHWIVEYDDDESFVLRACAPFAKWNRDLLDADFATIGGFVDRLVQRDEGDSKPMHTRG